MKGGGGGPEIQYCDWADAPTGRDPPPTTWICLMFNNLMLDLGIVKKNLVNHERNCAYEIQN